MEMSWLDMMSLGQGKLVKVYFEEKYENIGFILSYDQNGVAFYSQTTNETVWYPWRKIHSIREAKE